VLIVVVCGCVVGCVGRDSSEEVLGSADMEAVLYDYQRLLGLAAQQSFDNPTKQACKQYIFQKHHITEAQFDSSMVWYTRNTFKLSEIYTRLRKRFEGEYENLSRIVGGSDQSVRLSPEGDSVNLWCFNDYYLLSRAPLNTNFTFSLESDSNYHPNDSFVLSARFTPLNSPDSFLLVVGLRAESTDANYRSQTKQIREAGADTLSIHLTGSSKMQNLTGFAYLPATFNHTSSPLILVHQLKLMRYHVAQPDSVLAADSPAAETADSVSAESPSVSSAIPFEMEEIADTMSAEPRRVTPEELRNKSKKPSQVRPLNQLDNSKHIRRPQIKMPKPKR